MEEKDEEIKVQMNAGDASDIANPLQSPWLQSETMFSPQMNAEKPT